MDKKYTSTTTSRTPRPRSKRLRGQGIGSTSSTVVLNAEMGNRMSGDGHTHANKSALDQISTDSDGYEYLTRLKEVTTTDEETGEESSQYESVTEKVKAGYADLAYDLAEDSPAARRFLSRIADDIAEGRITFQQGLISVDLAIFKNGVKFGSDFCRIDDKGNARLNEVSVGELHIGKIRLSWDADNNALKIDSTEDGKTASLYATGGVSSLGFSPDGGGGATMLSDLLDVSVGGQTQGQVLGWDGNGHWVPMSVQGGLDESALASYLASNNYAKKTDIPSLSGYATENWVNSQGFLKTHQTLRTLTVQKNGTQVGTFNPNADATINITDVASAATLSSHTGNTTVHITAAERTAWNKVVADFAAITGTDTDTIINKWEEVVAFLDAYTEADTLAGLLGNKADKTVQVKAGTGLTGGGTLASDRTLSLATSGVTAGTYTKITVDAYGRATAGASLSASDIPSLDWSKITTGKPTTLAGYGITNAYTKTEADGRYVNVSGDTMTGNLAFAEIGTWPVSSTETYPIESRVIRWSGSSDFAEIFYRISGADKGNLVLNVGDDSDPRILFEWSKNTSYIFNKTSLLASEVAATFKSLKIGDCEITWDAANGGLKFSKGIYSESYVSALGASSGAGSGGGVDMTTVWEQLGKNTAEQINPSHLTSALSGYATESWVNAQGFLKAITKSQVESVLTGNITTHTHSQYLTAHQSLSDYYTKSEANARYHSSTLTSLIGGINSTIVTFDKSGIVGAPSNTSWLNGFVSTHNNYLSSIIANQHRSNGWYAGWVESSEPNPSVHWVELIHSGNISSYAITQHQSLANYVTLNGAQTITGKKTFNADVALSGNKAILLKTSGTDTIVNSSASCIHIGKDEASATDANLRFGSWFGIGWYPTIANQTVPQGENAMWLNVRNGNLTVRGKFIKHGGTSSQFLKADGSVDGTAYLSASSYTAADILAKIKTVDGAGSGLDADLLDGVHASGFVKSTGLKLLQYNQGNWMKFLTFTIPSGSLSSSISFSYYPSEYNRDRFLELNINIRSNSILFYIFEKSGTATFKCVGDGTTFTVWIKCEKSGWDGYGIIVHKNSYSISSYNYEITGYQDAEPTGTCSAYSVLTGHSALSDIAKKLQTPRTLTIGNTGKSFDGSANVAWSLAEIGALPAAGGTMTGSLILKGDTTDDMSYAGNIHPRIRFDNVDSSQNVALIFTDYDSYRSPAGLKLVGNQGGEWFEAPSIYATNFYGALSGNATSASKLATARTIWGQSFDGTGNVSGLLTATIGLTHSGIKLGDTYLTAIDGQVIFQNNSEIRFGGDEWDYNKWAGLKYDKTNKIVYLGVADGSVFSANSPQTGHLTLAGITQMNVPGKINFSGITGTTVRDILYAPIADNDYFRIRVGGTASNAGFAEIATADDGNEPIYVRQYTGVFSTVARTLTLLDTDGSTTIPSVMNVNDTVRIKTPTGNYSEGIRLYGSSTNDSWSNINFGCDLTANDGTHANQWILGRNASNNFVLDVNGSSGNIMTWLKSGNVGIGKTSPAYKLDVGGSIIADSWIRTRNATGWYNETYGGGWYMSDSSWLRTHNSKGIFTNTGQIYTTTSVRIGDCTISWDSSNNALKFDKTIYSTGGVSSLGTSSGSSGGGGLDWAALAASTTEQINKSHLSGAMSEYCGIAQELTARKVFNANTWILKANENNEIRHVYYNNNTIGQGSQNGLAAIRNAMSFRWYGTYWEIGNVRSGGIDSDGFGIGLRNSSGIVDLGLLVRKDKVMAQGFQKFGYNDNYVLLAGGGVKAVSDFGSGGSSSNTFNGDITNTATGIGTYNKFVWKFGSDGINMEAPRKTNLASGDVIPIRFGWRGGFYPLTINESDVHLKYAELYIDNGEFASPSKFYEDGDGLNIYSEGCLYNACRGGFYNAYGDIETEGKVYAKAFTNTSDIRLKDIISGIELSISHIADSPLFKFTWRNENDYTGIHAGTSAQYWADVMPEAVSRDKKGFLSIQYDVIALLSTITVARKVRNHEERISELEAENDRLKEEIKELKKAA